MERASGEHAASPAPDGTTAVGSARESGCFHTLAVVGSHDALLDVALPFLDAGLSAGDATLLACSAGTADELRRALGERAGAVECDARVRIIGVRPPDGLAGIRARLARAARTGSGRLRVFGEVPGSEDPLEWREAHRFEAAVNGVLGSEPLSVLCTYDSSRHPSAVIAGARATHPLLLDGAAARASADFREPRAFIRSLPVPREPAEAQPPVFALDAAPTLPDLRHALRAVLEARVPDEEQRGDLYLAVSEVAANAFRHGSPPVSARVWTDGDRIVCAVTDSGHRFDDPLAGFVPAHGDDLARGGMGLWLARKLWDSVDLLAGAEGFTVRLSTRLR